MFVVVKVEDVLEDVVVDEDIFCQRGNCRYLYTQRCGSGKERGRVRECDEGKKTGDNLEKCSQLILRVLFRIVAQPNIVGLEYVRLLLVV